VNAANHIRVLVADDHPAFREGVASAVMRREDMELAGVTSEGRLVLEAIRELNPDVAVVGMKMDDLDGLAVLKMLEADALLPTRVLFLSAFFEPATVHEAIRAGAGGYVSKEYGSEAICDAIAAVAHGHTVLCSDAQEAISSHVRDQPPAPLLSPREREVLELAAAGHSTAAIAERLYVSPATVKTQLHRIYQKLGVGDRTSAVAEAMRRGLVT
jgi:two-component system nitrate/nitrite response regulator NarL